MTPTVLVTHPTPDLYGASRMALESVRGFRQRGWRVKVVLPGPGPLVGALGDIGADVHLMGSPVLRKVDVNPLGALRLVARLCRGLPAGIRLVRRERPDAIYVSTLTDPFWILLGWLCRVPVVCHIHEAESTLPSALRRALTAPLVLTRSIIANSEFTASVAAGSWAQIAGRCAIVPNGVTVSHSTPVRRHPEPPVRLLYVGRLSERKGVEDAVDAVATLVGRGMAVTLDLVGAVYPGYESFERALRQRASQPDLAGKVHFLGFDDEVGRHLADADIVLVPSRVDESFGNVAVESVLAGRPAVATKIGGLVESAGGYASVVMVEPEASGEIADAVEEIVRSWDERRPAIAAAALTAAARHSPERYRTQIAAVVQGAAR